MTYMTPGNRFCRRCLFGLLVFFVFVAVAGERWAELRQRYLGLKTLAGSFTQTVVSDMSDEPMVFKGRFYFALPDRFRLEVKEPVEQVIVGSDSMVIFYLPAEKRVVFQRRSQPAPVLAFIQPLLDTTSIVTEQEEDGIVVLTFVSGAGALFEDMKIELDRSGTRVAAVSFVDDWGNRCRFVLSEQRWNVALPAKLFKFVPPAGTTVEYQ